MLDVLFKQNPLVCLPQISLGICWTNFIGFCDIAFIAEYKGNRPSLKHCATSAFSERGKKMKRASAPRMDAPVTKIGAEKIQTVRTLLFRAQYGLT